MPDHPDHGTFEDAAPQDTTVLEPEAARICRARPVTAQPHQLMCERLDPETLRERRDEHHASVRDRPIIVETNPHAIRSDRLVILHHEGDLLTAGPGCHEQP